MRITDTLAIQGPGSSKLLIDQQGQGRIFEVLNVEAESPLAVSGLTFFGGEAPSNETGGAIISSESLKIANCVFKNNSASRSGGAIAVFDGSETARVNVEIKGSVFTGNFNDSFGGGAVSIEIDGIASVKGCTFVGNTCRDPRWSTQRRHHPGRQRPDRRMPVRRQRSQATWSIKR
jgi:predicted outer membrane repeat protein